MSPPHPRRLFAELLGFAGIAPTSVPTFILAQLAGTACAVLALRILYPGVTTDEAADVVLPHDAQRAAAASGTARG